MCLGGLGGRCILDVASLPGCRTTLPGRSPITLPAEHEGPISSVRLSPDGLRVLSTTSSGHLGFLDIPSREYNVLVRSHTAPVLALATECSRGQLATVSQDHTVRVWDLATLQQVEHGRGGGKTREPQAMLRPGGQGPGRWGAGEDPWCTSSCGRVGDPPVQAT